MDLQEEYFKQSKLKLKNNRLIPRSNNKIINKPILESTPKENLIKINIKELTKNEPIINNFNSMDDLYQIRQNRIFKRNIILNPNIKYLASDIKIVSYNILVPFMIYTKKYEHIKKDSSIMWFYRWELIKREIEYYNPDIICFQEVQNDLFLRDMLPYFSSIKYMGHFISMEPIDARVDRYTEKFNNSNVLGIATFYRTDRFRLNKIHSFEYLKTATRLNPNIPIDRLNYRFGNLILELADLASNKVFFVSNIHIISSPQLEDIKTYMIYLTLKYSNRLTNHHQIPFILCGDFNSRPTSSVYKGITTGINPNEYEFDYDTSIKPILPILESPTKYTKYSLTSSYASITGSEPSYAHYVEKFIGTLDYIFVNNQCNIIAVLEELKLINVKSIPDEYNPSDHILQMSIIRIKTE